MKVQLKGKMSRYLAKNFNYLITKIWYGTTFLQKSSYYREHYDFMYCYNVKSAFIFVSSW